MAAECWPFFYIWGVALSSRIRTTIVILSKGLEDFFEYNQFLNEIDYLLDSSNLAGIIQVASFHPDYMFGGMPADDNTNYSNRRPYPLFHLIREDDITAAKKSYQDVEGIPERNMEKLSNMDKNDLKNFLKKLL
jgi:hypothetical protein